jgi:hypothetical protein
MSAHGLRLIVFAILSMVGGGGLAFGAKGMWREFGWMTLMWGLVNVFFGIGAYRGGDKPITPSVREFLTFNLGLNLAYVGVGVTMVILGKGNDRVVGYGWAVILQGIGLEVLDSVLLFRSK